MPPEGHDRCRTSACPTARRRAFPVPSRWPRSRARSAPGLARAALAGKVDGRLVDTSFTIERDAELAIVTERDPEGLEVLRHSTAHLLAHAVKELFPEAQVTIGPVIENGFYYDFAYKRPFTPEDLAAIEKRMAEIAKRDLPLVRKVMPRDDAVKFFRDQGELYKAEIIASIPSDDEISLYEQGNFIDLCRGPHVPSTGKLKVFKLMRLAGAYWRGDSNNEMLQRVYGTAWAKKEDQDAYLKMLEEAEKRDHRRLGRQLDLFHLQDEAPGLVFWHAKGWTLWQQVEQYMRRVYRDNGYLEVRCPMILDRSIWERTGHWENYRENMFTTASENRDYAVKPMNCPGHIQIFNQGVKSYRDLPYRVGEFGTCHRNEPSGALHGLMRARGFVQDDGHIFCTESQILGECEAFTALLQKVYRDFGFRRDHLQGGHPPGQAHRRRRAVGQGGGRADGVAATRRDRFRGIARRRRLLRARRSSTRSRTRSAGSGSAAPSRSTSSCPSVSGPNMSARTTRATCRSCCTARSSARWSASSAS